VLAVDDHPAGAARRHYAITYAGGTLTVANALLIIIASPATMSYGGAPATVTPSYAGFVNGQGPSALSALPTCGGGSSTTPAGAYPAGTSCSGAAAANYTITYVGGLLTVTKATLAFRADDKSRGFGQADPALTYTVSGFVNGQDATVLSGTPAPSTTATPASAVGTYPITVALGTLAAANYNFSFTNGVLTVTRVATAVVASPAVVGLIPPTVYLGGLSARLTHSDPAVPVAGQPVVFSAGGTTLCTATTDAEGIARCTIGLMGAQKVISSRGYTATFAGSQNLLPSTGAGPLIG
jgi:hypothetical protein